MRDADSPLGVNEIAKICGMSAATVYRMLRTMRSHGWVYQDENEKYTVGYKISLATFGTSFRLAMRETAYHVMARLSESEHEAMNLVVRDPDKCYILGQSRTTKIVDYVPPVGTVLPLHASACGKILLSEIKEPMLGEILDSIDYKRMTASTILHSRSCPGREGSREGRRTRHGRRRDNRRAVFLRFYRAEDGRGDRSLCEAASRRVGGDNREAFRYRKRHGGISLKMNFRTKL